MTFRLWRCLSFESSEIMRTGFESLSPSPVWIPTHLFGSREPACSLSQASPSFDIRLIGRPFTLKHFQSFLSFSIFLTKGCDKRPCTLKHFQSFFLKSLYDINFHLKTFSMFSFFLKFLDDIIFHLKTFSILSFFLKFP